jgi:hypothetical protein
MKKINIRKLYYHFSHRYLTMNTIVITIAVIIGASWAWGSIGMMQRNFALQKEIDTKTRQQKLAQLEVETLTFEQKYYQSNDYKELSVRQHLGLANPGEKVLILPPNSANAIQADAILSEKPARQVLAEPGDLQQWVDFLFGGNRRNLQK